MGAHGDLDLRTFICTASGEEIKSGDTLKILGFYFGRRPNADEQVKAITRKFYARLWSLRHLVKSGVPNLDALDLYKCLIRPVLEYSAPAYHSLLASTQSSHLETLQSRAMKIIFGWEVSYETVILKTGLERLDVRREKIVQKFAEKRVKNERF